MRTLQEADHCAGAAAVRQAMSCTLRSALDATVLRAAAANGFGDGGLAETVRPAPAAQANPGAPAGDPGSAPRQRRAGARHLRAEHRALQPDSTALRDLGLEAADPQRLPAAADGCAAV